MSGVGVLLAAACVSLNFFEPTMVLGARQQNLPGRRVTELSLAYALVEVGLTGLGVLIALLLRGAMPADEAAALSRRLTYAFLIAPGLLMLARSVRREEVKEFRQKSVTVWESMRLALRSCAVTVPLAAAFTLSAVNPWWEVLSLLGLSFGAAAAGLLHGYFLGVKRRRFLYLVGGCLLCLIALFDYMGT